VRIGHPVAGSSDEVARGAQDARLADAGFTDDDDRGALVECVDQAIGDGLLGSGEPQIGVGDLLGERRLFEAEGVEVGHDGSLR
jgi:hypothetical protein